MEKMRQKPQILQIEINKIEAGHRSVFVSGWRPFIGWICGASLVWHFIGYPIATYLTAISMPELIIPQLGSADDLMTLVISLLGLGGFRTVEKLNSIGIFIPLFAKWCCYLPLYSFGVVKLVISCITLNG